MYKPRIIDKELEKDLRTSGAVLIEGPKWCGKTTSAEQKANSILYLDSELFFKNDGLNLAKVNLPVLLKGQTPRLIDEWQLLPELWDTIRFEVDHRDNHFGQFILTGSSVLLNENKKKHSGTGRFSHLKMRTMSLYESGDSTGDISLSSLFSSIKTISGQSSVDVGELAFLICRGGWPIVSEMKREDSLCVATNYYNAIVRDDFPRIFGRSVSPMRISKLLKSYARAQGTQTSVSVISKDTAFDDKTVKKYLSLLEKMFVIEELEVWNPNLRSGVAMQSTPSRYFSDPSIATASFHIKSDALVNDLKTMGFLFETMAIRDLRIYAESFGGNVYRYKDREGGECDAVIECGDGKYGLIEMKLGGCGLIDAGCKTLKKVENKIDKEKMGPPSFKMVLTGVGDYAYTREDGIHVVPIGALKN